MLPALVQEPAGTALQSVSNREDYVLGRSKRNDAYGNESSFHITLNESLVSRKSSKELDVRRYPNNLVLVQRLP